MSTHRPDETMLHAWMDGELLPESAAAVAQWLAEHPDEAARMAALQAQNAGLQALHAQVLDEPVPLQLRRALRRPPVQWRWLHALAAGLMLSVGLGVGYGVGNHWAALPRASAVAQLPVFVREAAAAHAVYVPEQRHPVEVAARQQAHLVQWLSKRLGVPLKTPMLDAEGFHLMGGRLLPGEAGRARAQFMYEDAAGQRLTLYVSVLSKSGEATAAPVAFQWTNDGATQGFYWIDGHQGYALSAALPRERLQVLAEAIYRQLE
ncbi:anti-sigma factor family protein [Comamonas thiooxydans]|uniref:anti-sigma factor family protein n=1 Tax=Comamonas thiooxydans TaxID=363952 RepID=UPI00050E27C0|nr:anti-sigma factor [Comamonas thiooxydans]KGH29326.1 anti-sigma factor [Comamonas thiooxydans]